MLTQNKGLLILAFWLLATSQGRCDEGSLVPVLREFDGCVQADFLVCGRMLGTGCAQCSYVRYYVTKKQMEFHVLWSEPDFTVSEYPGRAVSLVGAYSRQSESAQLFELWSGLRTAKVDAEPSQFSLKKLSYAPLDSVRTPFDFQRWPQKSLDAAVTRNEVTQPEFGTGEPHLVLNKDRSLKAAKWNRTTYLRPHTAAYKFDEGGWLASIETELPGRTYEVGMSEYVRGLARARGIDSGDDSEDTVPLVHLFGNRSSSVAFQQYDLVGKRQTLPKKIIVKVQDTSVSNRVKMVRSAQLLSVKKVEHRFSAITDGDEERHESLPKILRNEFSTHWATGFQTEAAKSFLSQARKVSTNDSRQEHRIANLSMQVTAAVLSKDEQASVEVAGRWADEVLNSPMKPYFPELAMQLMKRIQWSGTREMFNRMQKLLVKRAVEINESDVLDGSLNCRATTKMPFTILRLACIDESGKLIESDSSEESLRRAYLAASLVPSLKRQLERDNKGNMYAAFDVLLTKENFEADSLRQLSREIFERAVGCIKSLPASKQKDWHIDFLKLESWTKR